MKAPTSKIKENEAAATTTAVNVPSDKVLQEQAKMAIQGAREQRQKSAVQLVSRLTDIHHRGYFTIGKSRPW